MKSYLKFFALIGAVIVSVSFVSGCADKTPPPPPPAPEIVRPNS
jgi:hypothetical protein